MQLLCEKFHKLLNHHLISTLGPCAKLDMMPSMKSAYELAMERLQQQSPTSKLTPAQKEKISELDVLYKAKRAEKELFLKGEIAKAQATGDYEAFEQLQQQMARELKRLEDDCEEKKEKVRGK